MPVVEASGLQLRMFYVEADLPFGVLSSAHSCWPAVVWFRGAVRGADFWLWSLSCQRKEYRSSMLTKFVDVLAKLVDVPMWVRIWSRGGSLCQLEEPQ